MTLSSLLAASRPISVNLLSLPLLSLPFVVPCQRVVADRRLISIA